MVGRLDIWVRVVSGMGRGERSRSRSRSLVLRFVMI